jgi:hypothetical protein
MKKPSKLQNSVVEQIEKIGDTIGMIEGICHDLEKLDPVLVNDMGELYHTQPIIKFIIDHRKYTLWFNQMRDFLFQELLDGAYIDKLE